ncbi:MarR family transcriptional regulator [Desulfoluna sp.]|uniref:MarR family winged helix-turn-helix transcriptional regulator n=1 Tax=Desulfoluna sp. TaxID=2045199 RepID=UPI002602B9CC|nr:MarR family transcriptional regulator [Desulfoluna sp.]
MKPADMLQAQLTYVRYHPDIDESLFEITMSWFREINRLHETLKTLTQTISGHPKGRFDMLRGLFLHPEGSMRPTDLARVARMTRASSSHNLDVMERDGLILRKTDPKDRRSARVSLTPKGRQFVSEILPQYLKAIETVAKNTSTPLKEVSVQNIRHRNTLLESIIESIKEEQKSDRR